MAFRFRILSFLRCHHFLQKLLGIQLGVELAFQKIVQFTGIFRYFPLRLIAQVSQKFQDILKAKFLPLGVGQFATVDLAQIAQDQFINPGVRAEPVSQLVRHFNAVTRKNNAAKTFFD